jgi:hypothetical protein
VTIGDSAAWSDNYVLCNDIPEAVLGHGIPVRATDAGPRSS